MSDHSLNQRAAHPSQPPSIPWRALGLLGLALLTLGLAAVYTLRLNPEIRFYTHAANVKRAWAQKLDQEQGHKVLISGGSSAAFSVDGERLLKEHGLPVVNCGLHAGMEPLFLTGFAAGVARPGDLLLVALEPGLLMVPFQSPDLAAQMGMALGEPRLIHASNLTGERIHWVEDLVCLRPGAYHFFTLLGKIALRRPLYRYAAEDVQPSGWQRAREQRPIPDPAMSELGLSADARGLLRALQAWGDQHRVKVAYSLPWAYVRPEIAPAFQRMNVRFLREVIEIIPAFKDPALGVHPIRDHFADTEWHLTAEGAAARSDSLAAQLKARVFWTKEELERLERERQ